MLHGKTVLIIEDDRHVAQMLGAVLRAQGASTMYASDGDLGVRLFRKARDRIDIVITDYSMPQLDGFSAFMIIQCMKPGTPCVFIPGGIVPADAIEIMKCAGAKILAKPFSINQLVWSVGDALNQRPIAAI